ncbi:hypothetical protein RIF29_22264 [Crotalaria pallida]|uniref:Cytochrome P450 n=1 Tax=Crotalaria pallida TaxID=3830 RepID=A0AAN9F8X1_CROPI
MPGLPCQQTIMISRMAECTISMLDEWQRQATEAKENSKTIEMTKEFQELTADIIAHTAFGSSFVQGKEVFKAQRELQQLCIASAVNIFIPGSQYLPTMSNIKIWKLDWKMKKKLQHIVESRLNSQTRSGSSDCSYGDDLLGVMMDTWKTNTDDKLKMNEIMDECKTFFFAGHETTSALLTWTIYLLSLHIEWQDKLRQEVLENCGMAIPDADMLSKLKMVNIVLFEASRLYCPSIEIQREALEDMKLGNLLISKGTCLLIPVTMIHRSKEYWGEDANEFNPLRFINGVGKAAKHPNALLAFSMGPRNCIGQNFAMLESKTVMALILQSSEFRKLSTFIVPALTVPSLSLSLSLQFFDSAQYSPPSTRCFSKITADRILTLFSLGCGEELLDDKENQHFPSKESVRLCPELPDKDTFLMEKRETLELHSRQTVTSAKIKLQLFPINKETRIGLEKDGHNPYLELTLRGQKKISSVLKHLEKKWGSSSIAKGDPILFPYNIMENLSDCMRWTVNDSHTTAAAVYAAVGSPAVFQLKKLSSPAVTASGNNNSVACSVDPSSNSLKLPNTDKVTDQDGMSQNPPSGKTRTGLSLASCLHDDEKSLGLTDIKWNDNTLGPFDLACQAKKLFGGDSASIGGFPYMSSIKDEKLFIFAYVMMAKPYFAYTVKFWGKKYIFKNLFLILNSTDLS